MSAQLGITDGFLQQETVSYRRVSSRGFRDQSEGWRIGVRGDLTRSGTWRRCSHNLQSDQHACKSVVSSNSWGPSLLFLILWANFWEDWECFIFQIQCMVSVLVEIIFYCAWLIILVWVNEPKPKETTVKHFALRHHRSIEECTRENGESLKQYTRIVLATEIFSWSCQVWLPAPKFSLTYQPPLIGVKIKRKVIFDSCLNESRFFFFLFCFMIVLCPEIHGVFLRSFGKFNSVTSAVSAYNVGVFKSSN